jgi:hypothetical protein
MKYIMLIADQVGYWEKQSEEERNQAMGRIGQWWADHAAKGKIAGGNQLQPPHTGTTVRIHEGKASVSDGAMFLTDGPFSEAKETVGGYGILEVANLDEALAIAKTWPAEARIEVRPVVERM